MQIIQSQINDLTSFMQTEVYASLDDTTKSALVRKKVELCGNYFLDIAKNLNRNKYQGCYAPHKAVMIMAVMELLKSGHITSNVILLDKELKGNSKKYGIGLFLLQVRSNVNTAIHLHIWIVSRFGICPTTRTRLLSRGRLFMLSHMRNLAW